MSRFAKVLIGYGLAGAGLCAGMLAAGGYVFANVLPDAVSQSELFSWFRLFFYIGVPLIFATSYLEGVMEEWRGAAKAKSEAHAKQRQLREGARGFAAFMEDRYGWVLEMEEAEQKQRALLWFDQITSVWEEENRAFHELAKSDDWDEVLQGLGDRGVWMMELWRRRRILYQYAIAFSTKAMRAAEILRIEQEIQQAKVEAAKARASAERAFASTLSEPEVCDGQS